MHQPALKLFSSLEATTRCSQSVAGYGIVDGEDSMSGAAVYTMKVPMLVDFRTESVVRKSPLRLIDPRKSVKCNHTFTSCWWS